MHPRFEEICALYSKELIGLTADAIERHPGSNPSRWNIRQVVEHLLLTHQKSRKAFRERLEKDRPTKTRATLTQRWMCFGVTWLGYFPDGRKSPPEVAPTEKPIHMLDGAAIASLLTESMQSMDKLLVPCAEHFGKRKIATHHVIGPLSADQWRAFHFVHARHHLKQVRNARLDQGAQPNESSPSTNSELRRP